jgi:hypothetical protein
MAQPLLFRSLIFVVVRRSLRRLALCSSSQSIAPAIRKLTIQSHHGYSSDLNCIIICDDIFKCIPKFVNLDSIAFHYIWCTEAHLINLSRLEGLRKLDLTKCRLDIPDDPLVTLRVSSLEITSVSLVPNEWFSYFRAHSVSITIGDTHTPILTSLVDSPSNIQHLRGLSTIIDQETLPVLAEALSQCPPLQSLQLRPSGSITKDDLGALSFTPPPLLSTYSGPHELLHALSHTSSLHNLRHLELSSLSVDRNNDPETVKLIVMSLGESATRLDTLGFWVRYLTEDLLKTVVACCSNLKKLSISAINQDVGPPADPNAYTIEVYLLPDTTAMILIIDNTRTFSPHYKH